MTHSIPRNAPFCRRASHTRLFGIALLLLCIDSQDRVWVAATNHRVQLFTKEGKYLVGLGGLGTGEGDFNTPHGLAMDRNGRRYVVDMHNNRVQVFEP